LNKIPPPDHYEGATNDTPIEAKDMTRGPLSRVLDDLQQTIGPADSGESDARLMERFICHADGQAFASLLRRHGPMVYGVCRRVLDNADDAEDVFQATFLVLVRKARSLRSLASVGSWLYGVAYRTALEARRAMARRRAKEAQAPPRAARTDTDQAFLDELRAVLDLELARLPERYRQVIVLCDLEGQGRKDVARRLRCPEGTVASRLAKARTVLAARLTRHGLTLSTAALGTALAAEAASACVPPSWLPATIAAARHFAANCAGTAGAVSASVASLVQGVCRTMLVKRLTTIGAILFIVALAGFGAGTLYFQTATAGPPVDDKVANVGAQAPAQDRQEDARLELVRLKEELELLRKKTAILEARLADMERDQPQALFRGKPASFWVKALRDRDPKYRQEALTALGGIAEVDRTLIPTILASLRDTDWDVRETASVQLAGNIGDATLPLLISALKDPRQEYRTWVMYTIARFAEGVGPAVAPIAALLRSTKKTDRIVAAEALGRLGPHAAAEVPALMEPLKDRSTMECYVAATALGRIGPGAKEAVPLLIDMLQDTGVRKFAYDRSLLPLVQSHYEVIPAATAAEALGEIGPSARAALPALQAVRDQRVMDAARSAIRKIDAGAGTNK
jgi:RNA polymerase sigma factor (sigma-70 family)